MQPVSRLTSLFIPDHYDLSLTIERSERSFFGSVTVHGQTTKAASTIKLHAKALTINSVLLDGKVAQYSQDNDELSISHPDLTAAHRHIITVSFMGIITDPMHGLYPSYYEHNGVKKELLATQFESHHAREVFPCLDEPEAKATFDISLTTEPNVTVLSNMPSKLQRPEDGKLLTIFERTPRMSSYLVAFVVGDLQYKSAKTKDGVEVNVWSTPAQPLGSLDFGLAHAVRTIEFFNDYFGVAYPLPKSDHVALPDFSAGAMENWGLITYRERALLATASAAKTSKQTVARVIAHELSHQWFGNLVTMKWWDDLWLNESFANLMEYVALEALYPEWDNWLQFIVDEAGVALRRDAFEGVQPVQIAVNHPDEINSLFDPAIVYAKGSRLLRMLEQKVGKDHFRSGLQHYFERHAYQNTSASDLWRALSETSGHDVTDFMATWLSTPGYPVVSVTATAVSQTQLFIGPHVASHQLWPIPLDALSTEDVPAQLETSTLTLPLTPGERLNVSGSGHFVTHYSSEFRAALINEVASGTLPPLARLQLLSESIILARSSHLATAELVPLLKSYIDETNELIWQSIAATIRELRLFVEGNDTAAASLNKLVTQLTKSQVERLGWAQATDESEGDTKLRATLMKLLINAKDHKTLDAAHHMYETTSLDDLPAELRPVIIQAAVYKGTPATLETLFSTYQKTAAADLRLDITLGLSSSQEPRVIQRQLDILCDKTVVRPQDVWRWFALLITHAASRQLAWQWLQDKWQWVEETFGSDKSYDNFVRYAGSGLVTSDQLETYRQFFTPLLNNIALQRTITLGDHEIAGRVAQLDADSRAVHAALATND